MRDIKCTQEAREKCPFDHPCTSDEAAYFEEGSACDKFNKKLNPPPPPTNADHIRSMTDEELAEHNVRDSLEYIVDYDWDENPDGEYWPIWKTSDGSEFQKYWDAIEYEMDWLKQPYVKEDA